MNKNSSTVLSLCLSETNKAVDVCRERGIEKSRTLESFFGKTQRQIQKAIKSLGHYESIHIDEFSMTPNKFFKFLLKAKRMFPNLKFVLFGDSNQCKPPEKIWFDYMESKLVLELVDYNLMTLSYKNTRYDSETFKHLDYFIKNKKLPDVLIGRTLLDKSYTNVCYLNDTREEINNARLKDFSEEFSKEVVNVDGFDVAQDIPVVVEKDNDHVNKLYNSQMFTLKNIGDTITIEKKGKEQEISKETFRKYFNLGFCCTVYKYQGDTIKKPYNIYDIERMSFNDLYTALSRCVSLNDVHFNYTDKTFKKDKPTKKIRLVAITKSKKYFDGKIYMLTNKDRTWFYIGSTCKELVERLKEHKKNPVNKLMVDLSDCEIHLLENIPCSKEEELLEHEDRYIEKFRSEGKDVRNVKVNIKKETKKEPEIKIEQMDLREKFKILDHEEKKELRINWIENNQKKEKSFGYRKCGRKEAMGRAEEFRKSLLAKFY